MNIAQLYSQVTAHIIAQMEQGALPWLRPWKTRPGVHTGLMPQNYATGRGYHGINIPILWDAAATHRNDNHSWLTYKQAAAVKAQVRKGERGTHVVFTKRLHVAKDGKPEERKTVSMLRTFTVFNIAQFDGLPTIPPNEDLIEEPPDVRYAKVQDFVSATGASIKYGATWRASSRRAISSTCLSRRRSRRLRVTMRRPFTSADTERDTSLVSTAT